MVVQQVTEICILIWPGAYTCQICSIDPTTGNSLVWLGVITKDDVIELPETVLWYNNYTITPGTSALVDGAKRDRLVCTFCSLLSPKSFYALEPSLHEP